MNLRQIKRRCAWLLTVTVAMTAAVPGGAMADTRTGTARRILTVLKETADSSENSAPEERTATPSAPTNAHIKALESFNKKVTFVGTDGRELTGEERNIPETEDSFPYLSQGPGRTKGNIDLESYGYTEKEYFLKGTANVYSADDGVLKVDKKDKEYVNRIIMFQPEDMSDFSGVVYIDILNASSKVDLPDIWRRSYDYYMRSGHIYIGITSKDVNVESLKRFDPDRYDALTWNVDGETENGLFWDMLAQVGTMLKAEKSPLLYGGEYSGDVWTYVTGQSQSGFYVNTFVNNFIVANHILEAPEDIDDPEYLLTEEYKDAPHIFDGFLNMVGGMTCAAINSSASAVRTSAPVSYTDVPFILMVGENDYNPAPVREDSDDKDNLYRHYVVAGASHSQKIFLPDMTDEIQIRAGRPAGEYPGFKTREEDGKPHTVSDMNMDVFVNGALWNLHQWAAEGIPAPYGPSTDEIEGTVESRRFIPERDEYGNMSTGIMSPQLTVPVASYYGGANGVFSTDGGSMVYLDEEVIQELYSGREDYLEKYETALDEVIEARWILEEDRELMMELAQSEPVFGNPVKHKEFIEEAMAAVPEKEELSGVSGSGDGNGYTDFEYLLKGEANMYGVLHTNEIYRRRMYSMPYTNYVRVCVPQSFAGDVVVDLIEEGEEKADVTSLMKEGKAYVGITADPAVAEARGGSWEIPYGGAGKPDTRQEMGLLWDIISQTVNSVRQDNLLGDRSADDLKITLGYDEKDQVYAYTYGIVFEDFDGYAVDKIACGEVNEAMPLNSLDTTVPVKGAASADPDRQDPTRAHIKAVESFNNKVTFVGTDGKELTGDQLNIPETEDSFPYLSQGPGRSKGNIDLESYGYTEKEYFLKGTANVYSVQDGKLEVDTEDEDYVNRIIVFQPEDMSDFSGVVYIDILNASSGVDLPDVWRRSYDYYMRSGHIYIGITSKDVNVQSLKRFDPDRYDALDWKVDGKNENGLFWDMLAQVGTMLKTEKSPLLYGGEYSGDVWTYVTGQSQSGFYVNTFVNNFAVANHMPESLDDIQDPKDLLTEEYAAAPHIFDGFLNVVGGMANAAINSDTPVNYADAFKPVADTDVPFILLVGENDYNPGPVKEDSDEKGNLYRHYVIAGAAHSQKIFLPDMTDEIQISAGRPAGEYPGFKPREDGKPHTVSDMNMDVFVNGALWNLHQWAAEGKAAPYGPSKDEIRGNTFDIMPGFGIFFPERDEYGNMTTGIMSPQISVPVASYYGGANGSYSTDGGSMVYLDDQVIRELYSDREDYLEKYEAALDQVIEEGWILEGDRELMMSIAEAEPVFGNPVKDKEAIETTMAAVPEKEELSQISASAEGRRYTDSEYMLKGQANMYGVLHTNEIYRRRMYSMPYENYVRVCVPSIFSGEVVIDLIAEGEEKADVTDLMKQGRAYVGITADPEAAAACGGSWEIPFGGSGKPAVRPESGLLWDIISQTVNSIRQDKLLGDYSTRTVKITLGGDEADQVYAYTYGIVFEDYDGYAVDKIACGEVKEAMPLNSLDTTVPVNESASFGGDEDDGSRPGNTITGGGSGSGSSSSSSSSRNKKKGNRDDQWKKDDKGWWFQFDDGTWPSDQWLLLDWNGTSLWYYFNSEGYMVTGWFDQGGDRYYLHPVSDGGLGGMYTGWHMIDGKWYYFNDISDGTRGRLLVNTVTPDGYQVGEDGVWAE